MEQIPTIDHFNLWSFDLNLLIAFDALMRERNVTKAARRLKIQQPAMSHNLATLRLLMKDDLFVRAGRTMRPTPRAISLAGPVQQMLSTAHQVVASKERFDPSSEVRVFRIGFTSELEVLLVPELAKHLRTAAPNTTVWARPVNPEDVHRQLDEGLIDLGIGCYEEGGSRHRRTLLFEQSLLCCYNPELLPLEAPLDRRTYFAQKHALVSQKDAVQGCLESALAHAGVTLDVAIAAPEFLTILSTASKVPVVATLPARIVERHKKRFNLVSSPVPLQLEVSPISMVWAAHSDGDPASQWLRDQIKPIIKSLSQSAAPA
jgi:DNA-binding transcriptional LysR family regulator